MTARWRKVLRELQLEKTRTMLVVLAIATGLSAFATVLSTYAILTNQLDEGYIASNPASATIWTDEVDDELLASLEARHDVAEVEARREVAGEIRVAPMKWRNLTLILPTDYRQISISRFEREAGSWPPSHGEILIERDALQVARATLGDSVTIRTRRGNERTLRVTGSVHDVGRAQARMENKVYAYVTAETLALVGERPFLDRIELRVAESAFDEARIREVVASVSSSLERQGHPVRHVEVPKPGEHPHAAIMGLLLLCMAAFGLFVLGLSAVIAGHLMTAVMASQCQQIGIMKAVGGSQAQIATIYLVQASIQGLAAVLVALPAGIWGSRAFCRYMASFLNFDIESFAIPGWVGLLVFLVGIVVPLLASAYPVWKWSGVSVREALTEHGLRGSQFGGRALDRALGRVGGPARPVLLALRNGLRRPKRTLLAVLTLSTAGVFFLSALNIRASLIRTLDVLFETQRFDLALSFDAMVPIEGVKQAVSGIPEILRAVGSIKTNGELLREEKTSSSEDNARRHPSSRLHGSNATISVARSFTILALPAGTSVLQPNIVEGRGLAPGDEHALVVSTSLAAKYPELRVGATPRIAMGKTETAWRVVGMAREPFSPPVAYIPLEFFERAGHAGQVNGVRLVFESSEGDSMDRIRRDLELALDEVGIEATAARSQADGRYGFDQHMLMLYVFLLIMSGLILLVGGLGLATMTSLNVLERRREMGILRAIGASPARICLIFVVEAWAIGLSSWLVAALVAWPFSRTLGDFVVGLMLGSRLDFELDAPGLLAWLAVVLMLSTAASLAPAWLASRAAVREALEYE